MVEVRKAMVTDATHPMLHTGLQKSRKEMHHMAALVDGWVLLWTAKVR
jgi:hypothetical protein